MNMTDGGIFLCRYLFFVHASGALGDYIAWTGFDLKIQLADNPEAEKLNSTQKTDYTGHRSPAGDRSAGKISDKRPDYSGKTEQSHGDSKSGYQTKRLC